MPVIQMVNKQKKRQSYDETEKLFALGLHNYSPVAYSFVKSLLCLANVRSVPQKMVTRFGCFLWYQ